MKLLDLIKALEAANELAQDCPTFVSKTDRDAIARALLHVQGKRQQIEWFLQGTGKPDQPAP